MTSTSSNVVFDDIFTINAVDKDGKKFDRGVCVEAQRLSHLRSIH